MQCQIRIIWSSPFLCPKSRKDGQQNMIHDRVSFLLCNAIVLLKEAKILLAELKHHQTLWCFLLPTNCCLMLASTTLLTRQPMFYNHAKQHHQTVVWANYRWVLTPLHIGCTDGGT